MNGFKVKITFLDGVVRETLVWAIDVASAKNIAERQFINVKNVSDIILFIDTNEIKNTNLTNRMSDLSE